MAFYGEIVDVQSLSAGRIHIQYAILHTTDTAFRDDRETTFMCPVGASAVEVARICGDRVLLELKPIVDSMNVIAKVGPQVRNILVGRTYPATPV